MYLGLDPTFAQVLADPAVRASIPDGTQPTIRAALELYDEGWAVTVLACREFWRKPSPKTSAQPAAAAATSRRRPRPGRAAGGSGEVASASNEVSAATDLWIGDHSGATRNARQAAELLAAAGETEHAAFWRYVEAHAYYDRGRAEDLAAAKSALEQATANGPRGFVGWLARLPTWRELKRELTTRTGFSLPGTSGGAKLVVGSTPRCRLAVHS
jgi:hypothetical protein